MSLPTITNLQSAATGRSSMRSPAALGVLDGSIIGIGHGVRVLLADDERDTLLTLGVLLRSEGFEVELTHRSTEVPELAGRFRPHVILLDIAMPQRNGYELAKDLRRAYGDSCPVLIALTGYSDKIFDLLKAAGFQHHVRKPYDPAELLNLLGSLKRPA